MNSFKDLPTVCLREASWNPNWMDQEMTGRLKESITRYDLVENLVVRPLADGSYEVLSGNQRLRLLRLLGRSTIPCMVVNLGDSDARLLATALNDVKGTDNPGLKAEALRVVLETIPAEQVLAILPETSASLTALSSVGQEDMVIYLRGWERAQAAKLKHMQLQLTQAQIDVIEEAVAKVMPRVGQAQKGNPNTRGVAIFVICRDFLQGQEVDR